MGFSVALFVAVLLVLWWLRVNRKIEQDQLSEELRLLQALFGYMDSKYCFELRKDYGGRWIIISERTASRNCSCVIRIDWRGVIPEYEVEFGETACARRKPFSADTDGRKGIADLVHSEFSRM